MMSRKNRFACAIGLPVTLALTAACGSKPTVVGARTSQVAADTGRHNEVVERTSARQPTALPAEVGAQAGEASPPRGVAEAFTEGVARAGTLAEAAVGAGEAVAAAAAGAERGPRPADVVTVPAEGLRPVADEVTARVSHDASAAPAEAYRAVVDVQPKPACRGIAVSCAHLNDYPAAARLCAQQDGCDIEHACTVRDSLLCDGLDAVACEAGGCHWQPPVRPEVMAVRAKWWNWQRWLQLAANLRNTEPATPVLSGVGQEAEREWQAFEAERAAMAKARDVERNGACVAPERPELQANCAAQFSYKACTAMDSVCAWHAMGCGGHVTDCADLADKQACFMQTGCVWGDDA